MKEDSATAGGWTDKTLVSQEHPATASDKTSTGTAKASICLRCLRRETFRGIGFKATRIVAGVAVRACAGCGCGGVDSCSWVIPTPKNFQQIFHRFYPRFFLEKPLLKKIYELLNPIK